MQFLAQIFWDSILKTQFVLYNFPKKRRYFPFGDVLFLTLWLQLTDLDNITGPITYEMWKSQTMWLGLQVSQVIAATRRPGSSSGSSLLRPGGISHQSKLQRRRTKYQKIPWTQFWCCLYQLQRWSGGTGALSCFSWGRTKLSKLSTLNW